MSGPEDPTEKMILPVFVSFAIAMQESVAIRLLVSVAASFSCTIPWFCFTVKVGALRIICLLTPAVVRAGEHTVMETDLVGALAVVVVRIVARSEEHTS